jgi:hypothetical protein
MITFRLSATLPTQISWYPHITHEVEAVEIYPELYSMNPISALEHSQDSRSNPLEETFTAPMFTLKSVILL